MRTVGVYEAAQRYQSSLPVCGPHPPICFRPERGVHREGGAITVVLATPEGTRPKPPNLVKVEMDMRKWNESFLYFTIYIGDDRFAVEYLETSMSTTGRHFRLWHGLEDGTDHMAVAFPEEDFKDPNRPPGCQVGLIPDSFRRTRTRAVSALDSRKVSQIPTARDPQTCARTRTKPGSQVAPRSKGQEGFHGKIADVASSHEQNESVSGRIRIPKRRRTLVQGVRPKSSKDWAKTKGLSTKEDFKESKANKDMGPR